jgi:hypothetical protein
MLGIVLPVVIPTGSITANVVDVLSVIVDVLSVRVVDEIIVIVNCYVVVTFVAPAPMGVIAPSAPPSRSHGHSDAERNRHTGGVVARRWIINWRIGVNGRPVDDDWVVGGNVNYLRVGLFNDYDGLVLNYLGFYFLLLARFQIPGVFGFRAHSLDSVHNVGLLR